MTQVAADISITISQPSQALTVDLDNVPDTATIGVPYSGTIGVSGGQPPYSFAVSSGSLPDGLALDPNAGTISGTPVADPAETYPFDDEFVVMVSDSAGATSAVRVANKQTKKH